MFSLYYYITSTTRVHRVALDYAADLSVQILDHGQNAKEREICSSTMYIVQCACVDLIIIF